MPKSVLVAKSARRFRVHHRAFYIGASPALPAIGMASRRGSHGGPYFKNALQFSPPTEVKLAVSPPAEVKLAV